MKTSKWLLALCIVLILLLAACDAPASTTNSQTGATHTKLDDSLVSRLTVATQSGNFHTPLDATPDLTGTTIYFTATGPHGQGVFSVPSMGGAAKEVFTGHPYITPRAIAISSDGQYLYVTDPMADQIFVQAITGGSPTILHGSKGTSPQNLNVATVNGQQLIYFTGKDSASGQAAVLTLPITGNDTVSVIAKGSPLAAPDGVVVTQAGMIYVSDRSSTGTDVGQIVKIDGKTVTSLVNNIHLGNPAGIALSPDESILLVSALQTTNTHDQVLLIDLNTLHIGSVTKVVGQNIDDAGGLHASPGKKAMFAWADRRGKGIERNSGGAVYEVTLF